MDNPQELSEVNKPSLQTCNITDGDSPIEPFTIVIFGGAGDLSRRRLIPTLFHLYMENKFLPNLVSVQIYQLLLYL